MPAIPDRLVNPGFSLAALPLMWDLGCTRCCKVNRRCRKSPPKTTRPGWRLIAARSRSAALASSDDAGPPCFPAHEIPDIAAKSGIIRPFIPTLNGSKCANEHFSGCFRQRDRLLHRRMAANQQMRWSPRGAHMMLKVRTAVANGALERDYVVAERWARRPFRRAA